MFDGYQSVPWFKKNITIVHAYQFKTPLYTHISLKHIWWFTVINICQLPTTCQFITRKTIYSCIHMAAVVYFILYAPLNMCLFRELLYSVSIFLGENLNWKWITKKDLLWEFIVSVIIFTHLVQPFCPLKVVWSYNYYHIDINNSQYKSIK